MLRAGKELDKRNLTLVDDTCTEITLTLWGEGARASGERWEGNPVVAFKGIKVNMREKLVHLPGPGAGSTTAAVHT